MYEFFLVSQGSKTAQSSSCRFREMEQEDRRKIWWLKGGPQSSEGLYPLLSIREANRVVLQLCGD